MRLLAVLISINLLFISCSKEEEENTKPSREFSAKVDGHSWTANSYEASVYNGTIVIIGESVDGTTITISLNGDTVGLYVLDQNTSSAGIYSLGAGKGFSTAGSADAGGQVLIETINSTDNKITGSFNFNVVRSSDDSTIVITEGKFVNIPYSNLPLGLDNNSLSVDVDGSSWTPLEVSGFTAFSTIFISAIDADEVHSLSFELPDDIGPGHYNLNYFTPYKAVYVTSDERKFYAVHGDLEITSHNLINQELEALFEIYMEEHDGTSGSTTLTNGKFIVTYE